VPDARGLGVRFSKKKMISRYSVVTFSGCSGLRGVLGHALQEIFDFWVLLM